MQLGPVTLDGTFVRLEPLRNDHRQALIRTAQSVEIWSWMLSDLSVPERFDAWLSHSLEDERLGRAYPFVVIDKACGQVVGSTRYLNIHEPDKGLEIGSTWYSPTVWGSVINPEAKLLLMRHAFDQWGAIRLEYRTDHRNAHSQAAIRKLGAKYEGMLRNHRIRADGTIRHTVVFSITREEWPDIQTRLQKRIDAYRQVDVL